MGPDIFIKLLGRVAFKKEDIVKIVTFKKGDKSKNYINGYNTCDGEHSLTEISKIIGVTPGTLSPILKEWEEVGIVYKIDGKCKKYFLYSGPFRRHGGRMSIEKLAAKDTIIRNALEVLGRSKRRREIFKAVNGRNTGAEIAKKIGIAPTNCLNELAVLRNFGLIRVKGYKGKAVVYEKDPFIKQLKLEKYFAKGFKPTQVRSTVPAVRKKPREIKRIYPRKIETDLITYMCKITGQ